MRIENIDRVLVFRELAGRVFTLEEIERCYPIVPAGTQDNYGLVEANVEHFKATGCALNDDHRAVLEDVLTTLRKPDVRSMMFSLIVEPTEKSDQFGFVAAHMDLVGQLAVELAEYQNRAHAARKRLDVLVRYASEMNDPGDVNSPFAGKPEQFKQSFAAVRGVFYERAPDIRFPFSPALRADLDLGEIPQYWPGSAFVDVIGATWYVHGDNQRAQGMANMRNYFRSAVALGKPMALDEFGGAMGEVDGLYYDNDVMLKQMLEEVDASAQDGVTFAYGTIFLDDGRYGIDATLDFLRG